MFPLPYPVPFGLILYLLLALDLALLGGGLLLGRMRADGSGRLSRPLCMALSMILVTAAGLQWHLAPGLGGYAGWVFLGMTLGFLGDLIMARLIPVPDRLIFGMLAFGLGHIVYIIALVTVTVALGLLDVAGNLLVWAIVTALGLLIWHGGVRKPGGARFLNGAALGYSLLMASMNALALALALRNARFVPLAAGAVLFLISDAVLGNRDIRGHTWKRANDVVWVTYNLGQMLIVYSVAAAVNVSMGS